MRRVIGVISFLTIVFIHTASWSATESPDSPNRWIFAIDGELNSALIGALASGDHWFNTVAAACRIGAKKDRAGLFAFVEYGHFTEPSYDEDVSNSLLSFGAGTHFDYFNHHMRSMIQLGATMLLTPSFQNEAGTIGMFTEIRPAGFVIPFKHINLQIYPITLSWIMPVLQNIPLFYIHYRTAISVGGTF